MSKKVNLLMDQGSEFLYSARLSDSSNNDIDFSGYTVTGQIRKEYDSNTSTAFTANITSSVLYLSMNAATTANLEACRQVYDVEITDTNNKITRLMEGVITIYPQVTR